MILSSPQIRAQFSFLSVLFKAVTTSTVLTMKHGYRVLLVPWPKQLSLAARSMVPSEKLSSTVSANEFLLFTRLPLSQSFQMFKTVSASLGSPISNFDEYTYGVRRIDIRHCGIAVVAVAVSAHRVNFCFVTTIITGSKKCDRGNDENFLHNN